MKRIRARIVAVMVSAAAVGALGLASTVAASGQLAGGWCPYNSCPK
ncbi:hypothetical protein PV646_37570 [Streptomyces sp. ID05-26A]|jgi:hypothetical protein|nr:hypothetical protein [Streptomyces sp. ID05-26A]